MQGLEDIATAAGIQGGRHGWGPCPVCKAVRRGSEDRRGPLVFYQREGKERWKCHARECGAGGSPTALVAAVRFGEVPPKGDLRWKEIFREKTQEPKIANPKRPPAREVDQLWEACSPLGSLSDQDSAIRWLKMRGLSPDRMAAMDLARALPERAQWPSWMPWLGMEQHSWLAIYRLATPLYDETGRMRALRFRATLLEDSPLPEGVLRDDRGRMVLLDRPQTLPKALSCRGYTGGLVMADPMGLSLLRGIQDQAGIEWDGWAGVVEGEPDFWAVATHSGRIEALQKAPHTFAVFSVEAGSWNPAIAARIPDRARVRVWTDLDDAGERYATQILENLRPRCAARRAGNPEISTLDPAALLKLGQLPDHPQHWPVQATPLSAGERNLQAAQVGQFLEEALTRMQDRALRRERPVLTPWQGLNELLGGGLWPGLHVLVGNTGSGKSQWALQAALEASRQGTPVLYIGLELGKVDLVARLIGLMTRRKWSRLYLGQGGIEELETIYTRYGEPLGELSRIPFHLDVCPPMGWSYDQLYEKARNMRSLYPSDEGPGTRPILLVLDFLQLVASPAGGRHEDLRERIGRAAYAARAAARDLDVTVLLVSSTSRDNYTLLSGEKDGKELGKGSPSRFVGIGKESGEVEYAADSVLVLCRDPEKQAILHLDEDWSSVWVAIAKARAAVPGWVELLFNGGWFLDAPPSTLLPVDPKTHRVRL